MYRVLFVCTGNTCRSPMAAYTLRKLVEDELGERASEVVIESAGLCVPVQSPAASQALQALADQGIAAGDHRARQLTPQMVEEADLVLTMTEDHRSRVLKMAPGSESKVFALKEYTARFGLDEEGPGSHAQQANLDISDPIGQPLKVYEQTLREMMPHLKAVADLIGRKLKQQIELQPEKEE